MPWTGWVRAWTQDNSAYFAAWNQAKDEGKDSGQRRHAGRLAQREFRKDFSTPLMSAQMGGSAEADLIWGTAVRVLTEEIPSALSGRSEVEVELETQTVTGWVANNALARQAFVARPADDQAVLKDTKKLRVHLRSTASGPKKQELLWGDPVQVLRRDDSWLRVSARGSLGWLEEDEVTADGLLELYFIDVGQGDGVLVRDPDGRHLLIDGGLPRSHQQSGKNAADFVDWKFFVDYGDLDVHLDAIVASHCDKDHYGGLDDLVSPSASAKAERDSDVVRVDALFHAGLSYWEVDEEEEAEHPEAPSGKWLGPDVPWNGVGRDELGSFVGKDTKPARILTRLIGDETTIEDRLDRDQQPNLQGDWRRFFDRCVKAGASIVRMAAVPFEETATPAFLHGWGTGEGLVIRVLGPLTLDGPDGPALPDFESTSQNTNGHSVLLRLDYGGARILLTGDLNKNSMHYLLRGYEGIEQELKCDVAKGCHHGSHDISIRFLQKVEAGATVISSGDSEGYGHPRPEVVGASAVTGFQSIDAETDSLRTPLIYSTEVERGISLGAVKRLEFGAYPIDADEELDGTLFAKPPTESELKDLYEELEENEIEARFTYTYFKGVWTRKTGSKSLEGVRLLDRVNYGLVNVRTDGDVILCASQRDSGGGWTIHAFPSRFG